MASMRSQNAPVTVSTVSSRAAIALTMRNADQSVIVSFIPGLSRGWPQSSTTVRLQTVRKAKLDLMRATFGKRDKCCLWMRS